MLAISVRETFRDAIAAFGKARGEVPLASPATCEAIFNAINGLASSPRTVEAAPEHAIAQQVLK